MVKVILFDLDGTLLPMDTDAFINTYLSKLAPSVAEIVDPDRFVKALLTGTEAMIRSKDREKTNEQVFEEAFLPLIELKKEAIWPALDHFYDNVFPTFSYLSKPSPLSRKIVEEAGNQGYRLAVATNPLFPRTAIHHRLQWADVADIPFDLVTVYEESTYTKPHAEYYMEICSRLDVRPEDCIMVGNDIQEDMVASEIGMKTFLVEGYVIDRGEPHYRIDDRGTLEALFRKLQRKEGIFAEK
ncbi:haloacid dehalogenase superfamily, subfamily IA, variant 1 with third motif having Dx(3-4)D or Dx(3-4)E [Evansella caseinilytica]|uniref:Haloacid dehalogenase superfamily, subfamily IA, variant 1 with third motif having Dx(3-4)D or Dx(3-4)E n=1 Tax=Evansella caseinilytica TaxID=1503961 RepID=A0A1H3ITR4_9BACI|nr:HAD family hydrolase [Evansella caseinilytica]SDY30669.1 haloacid dehalogenase superfamily, subfamily IA, variant 1 with third motif having Dx(3-4)D or Dx(3-4)E [Evansella caseinilytica]